jgi:hypothetical protein
VVVEYYTDMQKIYNDSDYEPIVWGDEWRSLWMQTTPAEFPSYGIPPAPQVQGVAKA